MNTRLIERLKIVPANVPIDTNAAAVSGKYVNLKNYDRLLIVITQGAWAGGTPAVTLTQASDNAGTGAKTLSFTEYWQTTALTSDTYAKTAVTGDTFNLPNTANTVTLIEIHKQDLDINNSFAYVKVGIASPGANADLVSVVYILGDAAHECRPQQHISALA